MPDLAQRFPENPILQPADIHPSSPGMKVECLLNPGVFRFEGQTWLLLRVAERPEPTPGKTSFPVLNQEGRLEILEFDNADPQLDLWDPRVISYAGQDYLTTLSHLQLAASDDGIHFREPWPDRPIFGQGELESYGIEDCRVVQIGDTYYLTFTQVSRHGVGVGLRSTSDWRTIRPHGMILPPHNKDCAIFGEKIGGLYYALHRPSSPVLGGNYIWIAESPDLQHWGNHRCIAHSRQGQWDSARVGAGAAPIRTAQGWLEIYHGVETGSGPVCAKHPPGRSGKRDLTPFPSTDPTRYCLGALLLKLDEPWKVLARSVEPIMEPIAPYEQAGFFGNVVFTNGHVVDGDRLTIYYGASDSVICGARFSIREILRSLGQVP